MKTIINTENAPKAIGPYSQAVLANNTVYISGQLPINPATGVIEKSDIKSQTRQSLDNARSILEQAGLELSNVVKTTILLKDISNFAQMNEVYAEYFESGFPARAAYEVSNLPLGAKIEIEMIAVN